MALGATIYVFNIELANSDRGVYQPLQLRVARHPSESEEYFLTRILAYCLEYTEGISFSNGLFEPDEPTIAVRDLTGVLSAWIDVGAPEAARLHRLVLIDNRDHGAFDLAAKGVAQHDQLHQRKDHRSHHQSGTAEEFPHVAFD